VYSDLETPSLVIEEGAIFQGNCVMGDRKSANVTSIAVKA
jgi:cytoskeletal protein CcmA (bactofilin family)